MLKLVQITPSPSSMDPKSGGGEAFTAFLEKELIPYVDNHYTTAPYRTLIGHSLGGLLVVNTLLKHPSLFNAYVALDPSMSYDQGNLLKQTKELLQQQSWKQQSLFLGIANTMNPGMDTAQVRSDTTLITYHIRSILKLKVAGPHRQSLHLTCQMRCLLPLHLVLGPRKHSPEKRGANKVPCHNHNRGCRKHLAHRKSICHIKTNRYKEHTHAKATTYPSQSSQSVKHHYYD